MFFIEIDAFVKFLEDNHILATVIATIISTYITSLSMSFINDLILPILNRDGDGDGKSDLVKYENYVIKIFNINFRVGNFTIELFKFLIITYFMFIISKYLKK